MRGLRFSPTIVSREWGIEVMGTLPILPQLLSIAGASIVSCAVLTAVDAAGHLPVRTRHACCLVATAAVFAAVWLAATLTAHAGAHGSALDHMMTDGIRGFTERA